MSDSQALCRDCGEDFPTPPVERRCPRCDSPRIIEHRELSELSVAHLDCDAFYATVEKRDDPSLAEKPVVVGGEKRGVVMACCYIARRYGIRSAMPMRRALERCPHATVVSPQMSKYKEASRAVRALMEETTPKVEPISIDEAFLDLAGLNLLRNMFPAAMLVHLVRRIEEEVGITASIGLSYNKSLAKIASDLDKPRGFSIIGRADAIPFLTEKPVSMLWGVGPALENRLNRDGVMRIGQLRDIPERELVARYGVIGKRLARLAIGQDGRAIQSGEVQRSISSERTFTDDIADRDELLEKLWPLCEKVGDQLKSKNLVAGTLTLKLKTSRFRLITRSRKLARPTQYGTDLFDVAKPLVSDEADGRKFRLIGIGTKDLTDAGEVDHGDLFGASREHATEEVIDRVRERFGKDVIKKGRSFSV
jgi:DNA polymerase IV